MKKKEVFDESEIIDLGDVELTEEEDKIFTAMIEQSDKEIEEMRMQIRWNKKQIDVVKRASEIIWIPYQTYYVKHIVYKKAMEDI